MTARRPFRARPAAWLLAASLASAVPMAQAADINTLNRLTQPQFRLLSEDLGAALSFKPLIPSEPLGITGFDIGVAVTGTDLKNAQLLSLAANGESIPTILPVPTLRAHKGLPLNIDVGVSYMQVPDTNIKMWGGELRWAILEGSTVMPAVALRGGFTTSSGVDQLKVRTTSADISISKGFVMFTPYAGVGQVWVKSTPQGVPTLTEESFTQTKAFVGLNVNLGVNLAVEADSTGGVISYGLKLGVRF